jgi:hypothetical protein
VTVVGSAKEVRWSERGSAVAARTRHKFQGKGSQEGVADEEGASSDTVLLRYSLSTAGNYE